MKTSLHLKESGQQPDGRDSCSLLPFLRAMLLLLPLMLATPAVASAYTDPGSGAFVYQAAYAAFLGGTFYLRRLIDHVWRWRKKNDRRITSDSPVLVAAVPPAPQQRYADEAGTQQ